MSVLHGCFQSRRDGDRQSRQNHDGASRIRCAVVSAVSALVVVGLIAFAFLPGGEAFALVPGGVSRAQGSPVVYGQISLPAGASGAVVQVTGGPRRHRVRKSVTTGSNGLYRIALPAPGSYRIAVSVTVGTGGRHRHLSAFRSLRLTAGETLQVNGKVVGRGRFTVVPVSSY